MPLALECPQAQEKLRRGWEAPPRWVGWSEVRTPLDLYNVTRVFKRALKAPITYVAAQLGHSKPSTTLQWYAHWLLSNERRFVDALDDPRVLPRARWSRSRSRAPSSTPSR